MYVSGNCVTGNPATGNHVTGIRVTGNCVSGNHVSGNRVMRGLGVTINVSKTQYELLTLTDKSQPIGKCAVLVTQCSFGCHLSHFHYYCL